jgi:hypothetical protein
MLARQWLPLELFHQDSLFKKWGWGDGNPCDDEIGALLHIKYKTQL